MSYLFSNQQAFDPDSGITDVFGRLRTSTPVTMFSDRGYYDNQLLYSHLTAGSGTLIPVNGTQSSELDLSVDTDSGAKVYRQTRMRAVYQPGKSLQVMMSYKMERKASLRSRIGFFNERDGIYLETNGMQTFAVIRDGTDGVVTEDRIEQADWNYDKMDGTGPSGIVMDWDKAQILHIDLAWLGVGLVRVGFVIEGKVRYVHKFKHANRMDGAYMGHAALPVRAEIENLGVTPTASKLRMICQTVSSEGGYNAPGTYMSADNGMSPVAVSDSTAFTPIISLRMNPAMMNALIKPAFAPILNTTNSFGQYKLIINGTLTGADWQDASAIGQICTSATAVTGGTAVATGYFSNKESGGINLYHNKVGLGFDINGVPDIITLAVRPISQSCNILAGMSWTEFY